jgi:hypothetical protein
MLTEESVTKARAALVASNNVHVALGAQKPPHSRETDSGICAKSCILGCVPHRDAAQSKGRIRGVVSVRKQIG